MILRIQFKYCLETDLKEISDLKRGTCKSGPRGAANAAKSLRWKYLINARPNIEIILE